MPSIRRSRRRRLCPRFPCPIYANGCFHDEHCANHPRPRKGPAALPAEDQAASTEGLAEDAKPENCSHRDPDKSWPRRPAPPASLQAGPEGKPLGLPVVECNMLERWTFLLRRGLI